ncbi:MAG: hypothetical protein QM496_18445 [Verrucomicrobiota bacterium]
MPLHPFIISAQKIAAWLCLLTLLLGSAPSLSAIEKNTLSAMELMRDECLRCHKKEKKKGGLLLTSRQALLDGGDTGPAIVPGKAVDSFLLEGLEAEADPHMPPKKQLSKKEIEMLSLWINQGAAWDAKTLAKIKAPPAPNAKDLAALPSSYRPVLTMALSPNAKTLATGQGGDIVLFDFLQADAKQKTKTRLQKKSTLPAHKDAVQSLIWSPDGKKLASGAHREIRIWQPGQDKALFTLNDKLNGRITVLTITHDNKTLLAADSIPSVNADIHIIDLASGKILRTINKAHADTIFSISLSPDKKHFATVSADKLIKIWDLSTWKTVATLEGHTGFVLAAAYSPKGDRLATSGDDEVIKVWDIKSKKQLQSFGSKLAGPITGLRWISDPEKVKKKAAEKDKKKAAKINTDKIFAISEDGRPRTYGDLVLHDGAQRSTGAREKAYTAQKESLATLAVATSKDRKAPFPFLFAGSDSGSLFIWDAAGKLVFQQHPNDQVADSTAGEK